MSKSWKWLMTALIVITAASLIAMVFTMAHHPDTDEDEQEAVKTPSHVSTQNGLTVINLGPQEQKSEDIHSAPLKQTSMRAELRGTAVVLTVTDLANVRNGYVAAARTKLERDQADVSVLRSQYERVKELYQQNQNMSLKAMQDAETAYRTAQAEMTTDQEDADLQLDVVRQNWGPVVTDWVAKNAPVLESILEQREFLAQVVFPPGEVARPPATLSLSAPGNHFVEARYVSSLPQVNPEIQGISFLYLVPNTPGIAVGMNLVVFVPIGHSLRGSVVPNSAIVWWQGRAWAYEETSPNTFTRRAVPTDNPVPSGYFVPAKALTPGARIVTSGAQALLSEEFRSQIQQED